MAKLQGFSFYVDLPEEIKGTPQVRNIVDNFDLHGDLVSLRRISGESNADYKLRLWDASVHPGGPLYEGVVNGIAREFGLLRVPAITIDIKKASDGSPIALSPRVDILANRVVLYSDWRPDGTAVIDREIRFYQLSDSGYYLDDLATEINKSEYFSAALDAEIRPNTITATIVRKTSNLIVRSEHIRGDKFTQLENSYIVRGSVTFIEKDVFDVEVSGVPAAEGEYSIGYSNGEIMSFVLPSGRGYCAYMAASFPMKVDVVPVQIFTFQDDDFQYELFEKKELDSGELINALPNVEGSEIYHQLFKETEVFWGK